MTDQLTEEKRTPPPPEPHPESRQSLVLPILLPLGGIELTVDGEKVQVPDRVAYKGMMLQDVPNMAFAIGYTNASWTLKVDLVSAYVSRMLHFMAEKGYASVTARLPAEGIEMSPLIDMSSGYFERARHLLPRQGDQPPWRLRQHYFKDAALFRGPIEAKELEFRRAPALTKSAS